MALSLELPLVAVSNCFPMSAARTFLPIVFDKGVTCQQPQIKLYHNLNIFKYMSTLVNDGYLMFRLQRYLPFY